MSLLPFLFDDADLWGSSRRRNRNDGWLDEFIEPSLLMPRRVYQYPDYLRNLNAALQDKGANVTCDKDKFQANFDIQHFKPEEISVKVNEDTNMITIEGKHEEKQDEHGQIYRHFVRKYTLPKDCNIKKLESKLSSDGVLSITAPKTKEQKKIEDHRSIPIIRTGQPARSVENKGKKMEE